MSRYLLIEPAFPISNKSRNHKNFLPIGLLKLSTFLKSQSNEVRLFRGIPSATELVDLKNFKPDYIWITSLFTYWSEYVTQTVQHFKNVFPKIEVTVGGIFASLFKPDKIKEITGCDHVFQGVHFEAESHEPDYELLEEYIGYELDFQILHASRGCRRHCEFCGTWKIENEIVNKSSIVAEIKKKNLVFYDNNFFHNPNIEDILSELITLKERKQISVVESQSGFDGRELLENPKLAILIKKAGFKYPKIAWDWGLNQEHLIKQQIDILKDAGYKSRDISVFMIYNWKYTFDEMEEKRKKCWNWRVQISDCRYRPLDQLFDNYNPHLMNQSIDDYYIHTASGWNDTKIKLFRRHIRQQNICIRQRLNFYSSKIERFKIDKEIVDQIRTLDFENQIRILQENDIEYWIP